MSRKRFGLLVALLLGVTGLAVLTPRSPAVQAQTGTLDPSFGVEGVQATVLGSETQVFAVAALADGGLAMTGVTATAAQDFDLYVARATADGRPDLAFGEGGSVRHPLTTGADAGYAITGLAGGRLLVAGVSHRDGPALALARLWPDGTLDTAFGVDGVAVAPLAAGESVAAVTELADGRLLVAGSSPQGEGSALRLACFRTDGAADAGFGDGGRLVLPFTGARGALALAATADGGAVVAGGGVRGADLVLATMRLTAGGTPRAGEQVLAVQMDAHTATALRPRPDGVVEVAALFAQRGGQVLLAQVEQGGTLVAAGPASAITRPLEQLRSVALTGDGRVVVIGIDHDQTISARYQGFTALAAPPTATPPPPRATATATATPAGGPGPGSVRYSESMIGSGALPRSFPVAGVQAEYTSVGYSLSIDGPARDRLVLATAPGEYGDTTTAVQFTVQRSDERQRVDVLTGCRLNAAGTSGYVLVVVFAGSAVSERNSTTTPWQVMVLRLDGDRRTALVPQQSTSALRKPAETNQVELTCAGNTISATVNGVSVASVNDTTYQGGYSGIGGSLRDVEPATIRFRALSITQR